MGRMGLWKRAGALGGAAVLALAPVGCGSSNSDTESTASAISEALEQSGQSSDAVEIVGLMRGKGASIDRLSAEGFRCDAAPEITNVTICGVDLPATVHLEWTNCAAPDRPGRGEGRHHGEGPGTSSGMIDITNTYTAPADCAGVIDELQVATFKVDHTRPDGDVFTVEGTANATLKLPSAGADPTSKSTTFDVTRTKKDSAGTVESSVHLTGTRSVAYAAATVGAPVTRTVNDNVSATFSDGTTTQATSTDVVIPPMDVCAWPTSGTVNSTDKDGTAHVLVYGPDCGTATLDGAAIELHRPGRRGGGGHHH